MEECSASPHARARAFRRTMPPHATHTTFTFTLHIFECLKENSLRVFSLEVFRNKNTLDQGTPLFGAEPKQQQATAVIYFIHESKARGLNLKLDLFSAKGQNHLSPSINGMECKTF